MNENVKDVLESAARSGLGWRYPLNHYYIAIIKCVDFNSRNVASYKIHFDYSRKQIVNLQARIEFFSKQRDIKETIWLYYVQLHAYLSC